MPRSKSRKNSPSKRISDLVEFFETHDMGEYWDQLPEVEFDVDIRKTRHLIEIDKNVADRIKAIAKSERTSAESLVNSWLKEKIHRRHLKGSRSNQ